MAKLTDLFGNEYDFEFPSADEPTEAWVEGWECYMYNGLSDNPYPVDCWEHREWQDGYDAAERD
jgi:hypothetical protein